ncbi:nuclear transport factor 2 family protein [Chitinophaga sp. sic0106]|uniref:YybH family protein n=1 Tax=Chitinophaga sp. sic0106 TaxID=2854785 RepID=UPI001C44F70A|nr:nuclear transport factor 2 family protein [Chitinophaga sp. sic0106]MBV7530871.1 nuclear transport factor 2 family protein [Chitinophaga sp. sic0106]
MKQILFLTACLLISCLAIAQSDDKLLKEARTAIEASNANYGDLALKNDGSVLTCYTDDACLFPPGAAPVCGKANLAKFFKDGPQIHVKFNIQHLYGDAKDFVTEESFYVMTDLRGHKIDDGKVVVIWKKTSAGWKMHRDMFSSNHPVK